MERGPPVELIDARPRKYELKAQLAFIARKSHPTVVFFSFFKSFDGIGCSCMIGRKRPWAMELLPRETAD